MSVLTKIKFIYHNWSSLERLELPSGINLQGYDEYKAVQQLKVDMYKLDRGDGWVRLPAEVLNKADEFKVRVLEGRL